MIKKFYNFDKINENNVEKYVSSDKEDELLLKLISPYAEECSNVFLNYFEKYINSKNLYNKSSNFSINSITSNIVKINSDEHKNFPVRNIYVNYKMILTNTINPNIDYLGACHPYANKETKSKRINIASKVIPYPVIDIEIDIIMNINKNINSFNLKHVKEQIYSSFLHELVHAYDLYKNLDSNIKIMSITFSSILDVIDKYQFIKDFILSLYILSPLERKSHMIELKYKKITTKDDSIIELIEYFLRDKKDIINDIYDNETYSKSNYKVFINVFILIYNEICNTYKVKKDPNILELKTKDVNHFVNYWKDMYDSVAISFMKKLFKK
jgi:hypothetical protein